MSERAKYYANRATEDLSADYSSEFRFPCAYSEGTHNIKVVLSKDGLLRSVQHTCGAEPEVNDSLNRLGLMTCHSAVERIKEYCMSKDTQEGHDHRSRRYGHSINHYLDSFTGEDTEFNLSPPVVKTLEFCKDAVKSRTKRKQAYHRTRAPSAKEVYRHIHLNCPDAPSDSNVLDYITDRVNRKVLEHYPDVAYRLSFIAVKSNKYKGWVDVITIPKRWRQDANSVRSFDCTGLDPEHSVAHNFLRLGSVQKVANGLILYQPHKNTRISYEGRGYIRHNFSPGYRHHERSESWDPFELKLYDDGWCVCTGKEKKYSSAIKTHLSTSRHERNLEGLKKKICEFVYSR